MKVMKFATVVVLLLCLSFFNVHNAYAVNASSRINGNDAISTSIEISKSGWHSSENAILVSTEGYADALTIPLLSKSLKAPVLFTGREALREDVEKELIRLKAEKVYVVGTQSSISDSIINRINELGMECVRISGSDKYELSAAIAGSTAKEGNISKVILASGDNYMDVLSASVVGARKKLPVLVVGKDSIPSSVKAFIDDRKINKAYIVGGEDVISSTVASQFQSSERIFGKDGYQRNAVILKQFEGSFDFDVLYMAPGSNPQYSMAGAGLAVNENAPMVFVNNNFSSISRSFIETKASMIEHVAAFGDETMISGLAINQITDAGSSRTEASNYEEYEEFAKSIMDNCYIKCADGNEIKINKVLVGQKNNDNNSIYIYLDMNTDNYNSLLKFLNGSSDAKQTVEDWMKSIAAEAAAHYPDKTVNCELWSVYSYSSYPASHGEGDIEFNPATRQWNVMQKEAGFMMAKDGQFIVEWEH